MNAFKALAFGFAWAFFLGVFSLEAEYEQGYEAFYNEKEGKATKPIDYSDFRFKVQKMWMQLDEENKFYWWWTEKYGMSANKKDKEVMQMYKSRYFFGGNISENAPSFEDFLEKSKQQDKNRD